MRTLFLVAAMLCSAVLPVTGCSDPARPVPTPDLELLLGDWARSYEEEAEAPEWMGEIFRPQNSREFPPSWFRMRYVFDEGGSCSWLVLHPRDAHYFDRGMWRVDPDDPHTILVSDSGGQLLPGRSFRIIRLNEAFLSIEVGLPD
jgi:hypothetical protein